MVRRRKGREASIIKGMRFMSAKGNLTLWRLGARGVSLLSSPAASSARDQKCRKIRQLRMRQLGASESDLWVPRRGVLLRAPGRPNQLGTRTPDMRTQLDEGHAPLGSDSRHPRPQTNLGGRKHESYPWLEPCRRREWARYHHRPGLPGRLRPGPYPSWQRGSLRPPSAAGRISAYWKREMVNTKNKAVPT